MTLDPRRLLLVLDDLGASMRHWQALFASIEETIRGSASDAMRVGEELEQLARQAKDIAERLHLDARRVRERAAAGVSAARDVTREAYGAMTASDRCFTQAVQKVSEWDAGVLRAQQRLRAAQNALLDAESALQKAESTLAAARRNQAAAASALTACRASYTVDEKGERRYRDCSREVMQVNAAATALRIALYEVDGACAEVASRRGKVFDAQEQVLFCREGLNAAQALREQAAANRLDANAAEDLSRTALSIALSAAQSADAILALAIAAVQDAERATAEASMALSESRSLADHANSISDAFVKHEENHARGMADLDRAEDELSTFDAPIRL